MCRHLGYVGPPVPLAALVFDPPHSLRACSVRAPALQDIGRINADGWGVGWYDDAARPIATAPVSHGDPDVGRRALRWHRPFGRGHVIAAARHESPGLADRGAGAAPVRGRPWLFTHNGFVGGCREGVGVELRRKACARREMR